VIEKSAKKRPDWVFGLKKDYLIVEGVGNNHDEAKNAAYVNLKEKVVSSVAVHVSSNTKVDINEKLINNISQYQESFSNETKISSNFITALRGVSLNKAEDFYWEVVRKKDKSRQIHYHVKYPFTTGEQNLLIAEWERLDREMTNEINTLEKEFNKTNNVNELHDIYLRAQMLEKLFSEPRKTQAAIIKNKIENIYNQLEIDIKSHEQGQLYIQLKANGVAYTTNKEFEFESNCAKIFSQNFSELENATFIQYEVDFCNNFEKDFIILKIKENGKTYSKNIKIPDNDNLAKIKLVDNLRLIRDRQGNGINTFWQIPLRSLNNIPFEIVNVDITIERVNQRLVSVISRRPNYYHLNQKINEKYVGKRDFLVSLQANKNINEFEELLSNLINLKVEYKASGKIYFKSKDANTNSVYSFENVNVKNIGF
jgi:hypothetical protein